jgi:hypothetical protein
MTGVTVTGGPDEHELAAVTAVIVAALRAAQVSAPAGPTALRAAWAAPRHGGPAGSWAARPHPAWHPVL